MFFLPHFLVYTLASPHSLSLSLSSILRQQGNHDHLIIQFNGLVALTDRCSALAFLGPLSFFTFTVPILVFTYFSFGLEGTIESIFLDTQIFQSSLRNLYFFVTLAESAFSSSAA